MNFPKRLRRLALSFLGVGAGILFAQLRCIAAPAPQEQEQQQQPPPPPPAQNSQPASQQTTPSDQPAAKQKKVWTEEDVILLRTPADNYQVEKEAKESAEAHAAAKEKAIRTAAKSETPPPDIKLPATPEETEKMLKDTQEDIQQETDVLAKLRKELPDGSAEEQAQKKKEIDRLDVLLEASQRDLKALQQHLKTLREKPQGENPPATPPPPPV